MASDSAKGDQTGPADSQPVETSSSHVPTIFRKCPKCGKRFDLERTAESVQEKRDVVPEERTIFPVAGVAGRYPSPVADPSAMTRKVEVEEVVEDDVYTETYKCKHCGYVWSERFEKVKDLGSVEGVGGSL